MTLNPTDDQLLEQLNDQLSAATQERYNASQRAADAPSAADQLATTVRENVRQAREFFAQHERPDLLDEWQFERFAATAQAVAPDFGLVAGQADTRADRADAIVNAWRETLGPEVFADYVSRPFGVDRRVTLTRWMGFPVAFDWALIALNDGAKTDHVPSLQNAIHHGREDLVQALLEAGVPANGSPRATRLDDLPLGTSVALPAAKVQGTVTNGDEAYAMTARIRDALVQHGADVARFTGADSLLHRAATQGDDGLVRWCVAHGADPENAWTYEGQTHSTQQIIARKVDRDFERGAPMSPHAGVLEALQSPEPRRARPKM